MEDLRIDKLFLLMVVIYNAIRAGVGTITFVVATKQLIVCWGILCVASLVFDWVSEEIHYRF